MIEYRIGDVRDRLAEIPDGSIDLVVSSPPFLALRSYLPADHPDKHREIGSEPTPADFLDTLLGLTAEFDRVLAPHGSICIELGDTYSGGTSEGSDTRNADSQRYRGPANGVLKSKNGAAWPLAKSLTGIPTLYTWSLAYGRNLLTGRESPAGQWRIRNVVVWARPNPPVGALGDKFRPATSYITVACKSAKRYFDLDAVRCGTDTPVRTVRVGAASASKGINGGDSGNPDKERPTHNPAGAPPLDWHADDHPEDGDWLWKLSTQPYSGKIPTVRRVPCGPDDGGERTASPDCPRHGDLPGQVPKALRDERAATLLAKSPRTPRNGSHPDDGQLPGFAPTGPSSERSSEPPAPDPADAGAATLHGTESRRTDPVPSTSPAGTPCAQSPDGTAHTSASPGSSAPDLDTDASSTSSADSPASHDTRTPPDTADTQPRESLPCTCSFHKTITEYSSHYATFPLTLPKRLIEAMCPLRVCDHCGRPSERITEATYTQTQATNNATERGALVGVNGAGSDPTFVHGRAVKNVVTTGWTECVCIAEGFGSWRTGVVLDPFGGSGTTAEAAQAVGRHAVLIDIDERNAELARQRVGMFLEVKP